MTGVKTKDISKIRLYRNSNMKLSMGIKERERICFYFPNEKT